MTAKYRFSRGKTTTNPAALGFSENVSLTAVRVFEHLTPRLQGVLYEVN